MLNCGSFRAKEGLEAERAEREKCIAEEQEKEKRNFQYLQRIREEGFRKVQLNKALCLTIAQQGKLFELKI